MDVSLEVEWEGSSGSQSHKNTSRHTDLNKADIANFSSLIAGGTLKVDKLLVSKWEEITAIGWCMWLASSLWRKPDLRYSIPISGEGGYLIKFSVARFSMRIKIGPNWI